MKKKTKIILFSIIAFFVLLAAIFFGYTSIYYKADETAKTILTTAETKDNGNQIVLTPANPTNTGFIFYPGAKVEETAYLPMLEKLQEQGITCVVMKMPFRMAIFNKNAADSVFENFPEITNWYIGGHSMGGAMASAYFAENSDKIDGLILLGAYVYGESIDPNDVCLIYGSEDQVLSNDKLTVAVPNTLVIQGGNHAYYGNYGEQSGDGTATISRDEQQEQTAQYILNFIKNKTF